MLSAKQQASQQRNISKPACTQCARRKVKCGREEPACSNCVRHNAQCRYEEAPTPQRHTKRRADAELRERIRHLEYLLQEKGIDANSTVNSTAPQAKQEDQSFADVWFKSAAMGRPARSDRMLQHPLLPLDGPSTLKFIRTRYRRSSEISIGSSLSMPSNNSLSEMHPEPRHIFRLWQVFAERTNPMTKIIHAPTVQQRISDLGWDIGKANKSFQALLFGIYLLAVVSLSADACVQYFGEDRNTLMARYANGTWRSLMDAGVFETRNLEVLQALVLLILADPASETATTLSGLAVRIGLKMGLDKEGDAGSISFFEQEMRVRLWWQLCTLDILARHLFSSRGSKETTQMAPDIRLPLNVNDAELHPNMAKAPVEYAKASEMVYILLKYESAAWGHRKRTQVQKQPDRWSDFDFGELSIILENKYLQYCDPQIPIHAAAQTMARSSKHVIQYMKTRIKGASGTPTDALFDQALEVLEMEQANRKLPYAAQLVWTGWPIQLDAIVNLVTMLQQPTKGDRAAKAWDYIVSFWDEQIESDWDGDQSFFNNLLDMTLDAWQVRRREMTDIYGSAAVDSVTPSSVQRLLAIQRMRRGEHQKDSQSMPTESVFDPTTDVSLMSQPDLDFNMMNVPQDWLGFNDQYLYNFGFLTDFSFM